MAVEVALETPLANALTAAVQPKLVEVGWASEEDGNALAEYIILMLVNGKTQEQIAAELSNELLSLPPDDPSSHNFAAWLFEQIETLNAQINGQAAAPAPQPDAAGGEMDTDMGAGDATDVNIPTGPKSMRNGNPRGGREKRMMGQMSRAMDRSGDSLHRVQGQNGRINTHSRAPPSGPRGAGMRGGRGNGRMANNIQHGLASGMGNGQNMMMGGQPGNMDVFAMLEQQNQMMMQMQQQLMNGGVGRGNHRGGRGGKFERGNRGRGGHYQANRGTSGENGAEGGDDTEMSGEPREPPNPDDTVCKYNLKCTNPDCKFAHQSPAARPGANVDTSDVCSFGAACKNHKCVGRHPSPATKLAHQGEQDCKFFPNCQNPRCPFRHPNMPPCRNGAECTTAGCKFTHVKTKCKFNPCLNPKCVYQHDEGQQGGFKDKVWTPGSGEHVSDRKFVEGGDNEETVQPEGEQMAQDPVTQDAEVIG